MDVYYYDAEKMILSRAERSTSLGSNESDLLLALIDGITEKEALISRVWGDRGVVISDSSYYKTVHTLRAALVDVGIERNHLKTLPRRGLILLCEITLISNAPLIDSEKSELTDQSIGGDVEKGENNVVGESGNTAPAMLAQDAQLEQLTFKDELDFDLDLDSLDGEAGFVRRHVHVFVLILAVLGILLPVVYAYLMYKKPPDLEEWKLVWEDKGVELYAEESESMSKEDVLTAMSGFARPLKLMDTNYYVRKPLSQLLISCVRTGSAVEGICVNYLRVGKK